MRIELATGVEVAAIHSLSDWQSQDTHVGLSVVFGAVAFLVGDGRWMCP